MPRVLFMVELLYQEVYVASPGMFHLEAVFSRLLCRNKSGR